MTVQQLFDQCFYLMEADITLCDKEILIAVDEEGNDYRPLTLGFTTHPKNVDDCLANSNSQPEIEWGKAVILG